MKTQLTRGLRKRLMYVENKDGTIDGADARIGWVTFSKSGQTVYYRGRELKRQRAVASAATSSTRQPARDTGSLA